MSSEQFIENNVARNRSEIGCLDAAFIRRCRVGRGHGVVDLAILPLSGEYRIALIEAKKATSPDATAKVIGQLLMYYSGAVQYGA